MPNRDDRQIMLIEVLAATRVIVALEKPAKCPASTNPAKLLHLARVNSVDNLRRVLIIP
jgi:hypothetical protein